jgi:hypothetical protein
MFKKAARLKLRFDSSKGLLTVEDLFDLPLTSAKGASLDGIAKALHREIKDSSEISFVGPPSPENTALNLKFNIVKDVIDARVKENEDKKNRKLREDKKARILEIIAKKQDAKLEDMSEEELTAMLSD